MKQPFSQVTSQADPAASPAIGIAVIGMSGRFPGAPDVESFWRMVSEGSEGIREFDDDTLRRHGAAEEDLRHPRFVRTGAPLDDPDLFDARFFGVNPRDAELMDPQHRVMLEEAHAALENAGYGDPATRPVTGVFVGSSMSHYAFHIYSHGQMRGPMASLQAQIGNGDSHLATRISYKLDLRGPSMFVQTACSTSLTAIHLACRSLLAYDCDLALAGGSSLTMPFPSGYVHMEGGMLSADGHCRSFDAQATGTVIGNGAGAVILKRLADALADGDTILAVVLGSAVNNDGSDKVGYTAPSGDGQTAVIAEALGIAGIAPDSVGLIEAHGTGTIIGDPMEVQSLARVYRGRAGQCWLGSVKSNVGHMLAAAGVAGFIKAVQALQRRQIPPSAGFRRPNPHIDFAATPFRVADALRDWPSSAHPRRAAVSSFGIGGSNAHVLLEEAPPADDLRTTTADGPAGEDTPWQVLPVSAGTPAALTEGLRALARALRAHPPALADAAWTLQQGRQPMALRQAVVARTTGEAAAALDSLAEQPAPAATGARKLAWVFPGQGAQRPRMFADLFQVPGEFREVFLGCAAVFAEVTGRDLIERVMAASDDDALVATEWAQPALFAVEYALARQWMAWGVEPDMLLGHSVGEFAAACLAGVFSARDAMRAVIVRGQAMQRQRPGAMLAIRLAAEEAGEAAAAAGTVIAAINTPQRCVAAGALEAIQALQARLEARGVPCQRLSVSHAFHSPDMQAAADELTAFMRTLPLAPPRRPLVSSATGRWLEAEQATDPDYWGRQVMQPVRFLDGLRTLAAEQPGALLEVGPGAALSGFATGVLPASTQLLASEPSARQTAQALAREAHYPALLARLWCAGAAVRWQRLHDGQARRRVPLPSYRFDRQRFWIEARLSSSTPIAAGASAASGGSVPPVSLANETPPPGLRAPAVADWFYLPSWRRAFSASALPAAGGSWVLLIDDHPLGQALARRLRQLGQRVLTVRPGDVDALTGEDDHVLAWDQPAQYDQLIDRWTERLARQGQPPAHIVHAWGLGPRRGALAERSASFESLLLLAQALGRAGATAQGPSRLTVLAEGAQRVGGDELAVPERALGIGPARVIPQEFPHLKARHIDLIPTQWADHEALDRLVATLATWAPPAPGARARDQHGIIALRGPDRWIQTFEKIVPPSDLGTSAPWPPFPAGGVHLVTGGLGGIGLVLADCLARQGASTLVLTTRRLPTPAPTTEARQRDTTLARIRALGCEVRIVETDLLDADTLRPLLSGLVREFGQLQSIVHAAGAPGAGMIQLKQAAAAQAVLRPKYDAVMALEAAIADVARDIAGDVAGDVATASDVENATDGGASRRGDGTVVVGVLVHCSSLSSVRGGFGQVDYCAANAFLDAHAQASRSRGIGRVLSINWGAWAETGMAVAAVRRFGFLPCPFWLREAEGDSRALAHPWLDRLVRSPEGEQAIRVRLRPGRDWVLGEHRLHGTPTMPGTGYLELLRAAWEVLHGAGPVEIRDVEFRQAVTAGEDDTLELWVMVEPTEDGCDLRIATRMGGDGGAEVLTDHVRASLRPAPQRPVGRVDLAQLRTGLSESPTREGATSSALALGPHWQLPGRRHAGDGQGLAEVSVPDELAAELHTFGLHPSLLDVALGAARLALGTSEAMLPFGYGRIRVVQLPLPARLLCHARLSPASTPAMAVIDAVIADEAGAVLVEIEGYRLRPIGPAEPASAESADQGRRQASGALAGAILSHEGAQAFLLALATGERQLVISPLDLDSVVAKWQHDEQSVVQRVAKAELPRPAAASPATAGEAPRDATEQRIAQMWTDLLGHPQIGRDADFFASGGDSLLGIQLHGRLQDAFAVRITLAAVFENPTVAHLAALVDRAGGATTPPADEGGPETMRAGHAVSIDQLLRELT